MQWRPNHVRRATGGVAIAAAIAVGAAAADGGARAEFQYVALGDSITFGAGASSPSSSWVARYAQALQQDVTEGPVAVTNLGVPGATSADLLRAVTSDDGVRRSIAESDVITIAIGTNDFYLAKALYTQRSGDVCGGDGEQCLRGGLAIYRHNLRATAVVVGALTEGRDVSVQIVGVYYGDGVKDRAEGVYGLFNDYLTSMNQAAAQIARENGMAFIDLQRAFNGSDGNGDPLAAGYTTTEDRVHPSDAGHVKIAALLSAAMVANQRGAPGEAR